MRLMFYAPQHTGHHFAYLARMLPAFIGLPVEIVVATTERALESNEYARTLAPLAASIRFVPCCTPSPRSAGRNAWHRFRELVKAIRVVEPGHVAVCYADGIWEAACLSTMAGRRPWPRELVVEGWIYRGRFGEMSETQMRARARRWLFLRLLKSGLFHRLHLDHELLYEFGLPRAVGTPTKLVLTPNPIVMFGELSKEEARRELGIAPDGPWISLSGVVARFKGVHLLLDAYRNYRSQASGRPVRLLLAGPHEAPIREMLAAPPYEELVTAGEIVSLDRYLNEREMYVSAAASDLVVAPYPHHQGRSSIILWAAAAGRPSLGTNASCIGHVIREQGLGETCDVADTREMAAAIGRMLSAPWTDVDARRVRQYAEFHRVENYQDIASQYLTGRLDAKRQG
jgi:glycosyltransferase involved in cell wall biosynthesis